MDLRLKGILFLREMFSQNLARPNMDTSLDTVSAMFGLSKERPILDHHPKAQSEMRRFSYEMWHFSYEKRHFS